MDIDTGMDRGCTDQQEESERESESESEHVLVIMSASIVQASQRQKRAAEIDRTSRLVLCHMSFILDVFLPKWSIQGPMKRYQQGLLSVWKRKLAEEMKVFKGNFDYVHVGSLTDGLYIPGHFRRKDRSEWWPYDADILLIANYFSIPERCIETTSTFPGYCRIREKDGGYMLQNVIEDFPFHEDLVRTGPAMTDYVSDIDYVFTIACDFWPRQAMEWITRRRPSAWPSTDVIQKIVQGNCHLVAKAHAKSENPEMEWRFSFVMAEKRLIQMLTVIQKQSYLICKMLLKDQLTPGMAFSSYCLKTTLLWTMEMVPAEVWEDCNAGLAAGVLAILDKLIYFLADHRIPMYFMPHNNLIEHVPTSLIRTNLEKIVSFRRNPLAAIRMFDDNYLPSRHMT